MTLRTLNYGNYGIFLIMGNAGFCPSAVTDPKPEASARTPIPAAAEGIGPCQGQVGGLTEVMLQAACVFRV